MPPPDGILHAMMVAWQPSGGRIDDDEDQHAGDRPGEGQLSGRNSSRGWLQAVWGPGLKSVSAILRMALKAVLPAMRAVLVTDL